MYVTYFVFRDYDPKNGDFKQPITNLPCHGKHGCQPGIFDYLVPLGISESIWMIPENDNVPFQD